MATKIKVIMFTDCVGASTSKTQIGDDSSIDLLRALERFTADISTENSGLMVKSLGDGHLLTFDSAIGAICAGLQLQQKVTEYTSNHSLRRALRLRIGIDVGDVHVAADGDVLGHFVDMAKRVESAGRGLKSPVLFTDRVKALLPPKAVKFQKLRAVNLKGSVAPTTLYQALGVKAPPIPPRQRLSALLTGGFFQVLIRNFELRKKKRGGMELKLQIDRDLEVMTTGAQKQDFHHEIGTNTAARDRLANELEDFQRASDIARTFDCRKWPLRYANGGALPIIRLNGVHYAALFYRDIFPVGWNIANGASDSYAELYFPERIIKREFGEELIAANHARGILRFFEPGVENTSPGYQTSAIAALHSGFGAFGFADYDRARLDVTWLDGPDTVCVSADGDEKASDGVFLSITPADNAIEIDQIAHVVLDRGYSLIDGEVAGGSPLGRLVGLFGLTDLDKGLKAHEFRPDLFFAGCQPRRADGFDRELQKCVRDIQRFRRKEQREQFQGLQHKLDLCPITRALLGRFLDSLQKGRISLPGTARKTAK